LIAAVAQKAIMNGMSVQQLEAEIERVTAPGFVYGQKQPPQPRGAQWVDPNVKAVQRTLEAVLGMHVRIRDRKGKGKITIEYGSLEDFDRIVEVLKKRQ
jgi:ParB family chromosome partitioning protein